jgi:hypothetical protein
MIRIDGPGTCRGRGGVGRDRRHEAMRRRAGATENEPPTPHRAFTVRSTHATWKRPPGPRLEGRLLCAARTIGLGRRRARGRSRYWRCRRTTNPRSRRAWGRAGRTGGGNGADKRERKQTSFDHGNLRCGWPDGAGTLGRWPWRPPLDPSQRPPTAAPRRRGRFLAGVSQGGAVAPAQPCVRP